MTLDKDQLRKTAELQKLMRDPAAVQALIAENERLQESHEQVCTNYNQVSYASEVRGRQIDQLKAENEALREEIALDDKLIADRDRLLNMFECPEHGQCIPYAMEQVEALRKERDRLKEDNQALLENPEDAL